MRKRIDTLARGLGHPEGPDVLPDGRIVMVETYTSRLVAWSAERGIHDYAVCGGGPNACMLGTDGAVYITQNGGTVGAWRPRSWAGRPSSRRGRTAASRRWRRKSPASRSRHRTTSPSGRTAGSTSPIQPTICPPTAGRAASSP